MQSRPRKNDEGSRGLGVRREKDLRVLESMTAQELCLGQNLLAAFSVFLWVALVMMVDQRQDQPHLVDDEVAEFALMSWMEEIVSLGPC